MAFVMSYPDKFGNANPNSFWSLIQLNMSILDKSALLVYYGYKDNQAWVDNKEPIGAKQYAITGDTFNFYLGVLVTPDPTTPTIDKLCDNYAKAAKDTPDPNAADPTDPDTFISFFENATQVDTIIGP
jgi:hypothetical protein